MTSGTRVTARPLRADETGFVVEVVNAVQPHHPWKEDEVRTWWSSAERMGSVRRLAIEADGVAVGWVTANKRYEAPAGEGLVLTFVRGDDRELLDGAWALAEDACRDLGIGLARTSVWEDEHLALSVLDGRGWERRRRERFWRLDLAGQRERLTALRDEATSRVEAAGLRIVTAADLGGKDVYPALHQVDETTSADIPSSTPHVQTPYDVWLMWVDRSPDVPGRMWVAVSGGRPVGFSYLDHLQTPVTTGYTGVLREHRGQGIARALKLHTLVQAIELGVDAVETDNDSENRPILHLNEELGYREIPGQLKLYRTLGVA